MITWLEEMSDALSRIVVALALYVWAVSVLCLLVVLHAAWRFTGPLLGELAEFAASVLAPIVKLLAGFLKFINWLFGGRRN